MASCIFCQKQTKMTKEHLWPDWLRDYLPRLEQTNQHWVIGKDGKVNKGKLHRPGDAYSTTLRVVCANCNNGWMSRLQIEAKPHLVPLITDSWKPLSLVTQNIVARWAVMFTMVMEYGDPATVGIPPEHRAHFMETGSVPTNWTIWIGRHDPHNLHPAMFNHFGMTQCMWPGLQAIAPGGQTSGFTVGRLFVRTETMLVMFPQRTLLNQLEAHNFGLLPIHPPVCEITLLPPKVHGRLALQRFINASARQLGVQKTMEMPD